MIQEYENHLKSLRQTYVDASLSQRISIAQQRIDNPDCGPNQLCNTLSALEAIVRAILLDLIIASGQTPLDAYAEIKMSNTTTSIKRLCREKGISPKDMFRQDWDLIIYAERYRNLLIHEGAYLRESYSARFIEACKRVIEKIKQDWTTPSLALP